MPRFRYKAIDRDGREVSAEVDADSQQAAREKLLSNGLEIISIESVDGTPAPKTTSTTSTPLPLESGFRALSEEMPAGQMRTAMTDVSQRIEHGETLDAILASGNVPTPLDQLMRAGLASNRLGETLEDWLRYARQGTDLRRRIWIGLAYSFLLLGAIVLTGLVLLVLVVPDLGTIFYDFGTELPKLTSWLISASNVLVNHGAVIAGGCIVGIGLLFTIWKSTNRATRARLLRYIPVVGGAYRNASLSAFCHLLAILVEHRVAMPAALTAAGTASGDAELEQGSRHIASAVARGESLPMAARSRLEFPPRMSAIFRWSKREAAFPQALHAAGLAYAAQSRVRARLIGLIVEPIVIIVVALLVAVAIIVLLWPLITLISDLT